EGYDETSLARAKTHWFFGEWQQLAALDIGSLSVHPERDRFALLIASANQQLGEHDRARKYTRMSLDWGCPHQVVAQVLIAGVHNTLGRAAALKQDEARISHHFEASVAAIGTKDTALVSHARSVREMARMGLLPQAASIVDKQLKETHDARQSLYQQKEHYKLLKIEVDQLRHEFSLDQKKWQNVRGRKGEGIVDNKKKLAEITFSSTSYNFYQNISLAASKKDVPPFILLDSKSLPRSGLHYLKNTMSKLLQGHFSFCEWYQDPGCCKKMPCALTGYAEQCKKSQTSRLRLIKSHDFELADPAYPPIYSARRVILIRAPLFLLTSYFALDQLSRYKLELKANGINLEKIWLSHEPEVLATAYQIMDESFVAPSSEELAEWLSIKTNYIIGFVNKWVLPVVEKPQPFVQVVRYDEIDSFIIATLDELRDFFPSEINQRIDDFTHSRGGPFRPRKDPYTVPSRKLSIYLAENSNAFIEAAKKIEAADRTGLLITEV
ncbi:MAG: hypothetical protein OEY89_14900, partial [Gammaproteobacteria bacterium]|nr:hypothetical protein [Gammaproteobacteria bacterium]